MIFEKAPLFSAPLPAIAYAVTEGGRLLYADPPARGVPAALCGKHPARKGIPHGRRTHPFSVGGRELSLCLSLVGGGAALPPPAAEALLDRAERMFFDCLWELKRACEEPADLLLLPQTLPALAGRVRPRMGLRFLLDGQAAGLPLPVAVKGRALFLSLGLAAASLSPFGELTVTLRREPDAYAISLTSSGGAPSPFSLCLLECAGARGNFAVLSLPRGLLFRMTPVMEAVTLRDFGEEALYALTLGWRALGGHLA